MIIGYTTGVFDLFHIGHLNLLRNAKAMCDKLVVGVTTDEILFPYKGKRSVIPFEERLEIIKGIRYVDSAIPQVSMDKIEAWNKLKFDVLFVGDDWHQNPKWQELEKKLNELNARVVYFPYTKGTSSTLINETLHKLRTERT